jgi:hypothetical protein
VLRAGIIYFLLIFSFAFGLGIARGLLIAPRLGEAVAVCLEIPYCWLPAGLSRGVSLETHRSMCGICFGLERSPSR